MFECCVLTLLLEVVAIEHLFRNIAMKRKEVTSEKSSDNVGTVKLVSIPSPKALTCCEYSFFQQAEWIA